MPNNESILMPSTVTGNPNNSAGVASACFYTGGNCLREHCPGSYSSKVQMPESAPCCLPLSVVCLSLQREAWNELSVFWSLTILSTVIPRNLWSRYNTQEDL